MHDVRQNAVPPADLVTQVPSGSWGSAVFLAQDGNLLSLAAFQVFHALDGPLQRKSAV